MFKHLIAHRKNTILDLNNTPKKYGIEVDIRSRGEDLIIHHDAFVDGENFEHWIQNYNHGTLILNVKEEGLEQRLLSIMQTQKIDDFFFLDQSFPFLVRTSNLGESRCAVRVSEFENIATAITLAGKIDWVWVDCFTRFPLNKAEYDTLIANKFKLCLVSPELQGRDADSGISAMAQLLREFDMTMDAVCTKRPDLWEAELND
ncbi:phosphatidylinositol-specific phospholipase C/glycerophosphodiester phosphodiesterase family protein [Hirschia baltica]|uniref:GP-PDE domain-containing protein n=1 Tax=Hirschia baltica (strain ATCC 49814 / DSM 5838 / IFAM 1418) TaxID=582402 RepID=C6XS34_HIRBI|nr:phosphatidylinositol-specific phospholipase C/glycerophosphodiester phosphodiesterase family protein [Hirschia baltica]ACT60875.1 conserved hypothetical protein [Hirschia baltica ATCC 49814]